jgi:predicted amidohydrolase YtcJ
VIDAAGGAQNYDQITRPRSHLAKSGKLTVRTAYYLFAQQKGREFKDYEKWIAQTYPNKNDHILMANGYAMEGAGENLIASGADFENFLEPRIVLCPTVWKPTWSR